MRQSGENYKAWYIDNKNFPHGGQLKDKIIFILNYAILAPSAHNTQPWIFELHSQILNVYLSKKYMLGDSDPTYRQSYESIGACIENICVACDHFLIAYSIKYTYKQEGGISDKYLVATFSFEERASYNTLTKSQNDRLFNAIPLRRSSRLEFVKEQCSPEFIDQLASICFDKSGVNIKFSSDHGVISSCAYIGKCGTEKAFAMPSFRKELGNWLRNNWTRQFDGMPAFTVGVPDLISWIVPFIMGKINTKKIQGELADKLIRSSSLVGVICGKDNKEAWINAGRLLERIALFATGFGYSIQVMGALVEFDDLANKLREILKIEDRPLVFFRLGKTKNKLPTSPRRNLKNVLAID